MSMRSEEEGWVALDMELHRQEHLDRNCRMAYLLKRTPPGHEKQLHYMPFRLDSGRDGLRELFRWIPTTCD